jgi:hypothetical protein
MNVYELTKEAMKAYSGGDVTKAIRLLTQAESIAATWKEREQIHNAKVFCRMASGSYSGR